MASYSTTAHGNVHSRGHSASSITPSPLVYTASDPNGYVGRPPTGRNLSWEEPGHEEWPRSTTPQPAASFKIKPYLRKMSLKEDGKIDLSRPAAENESLTGLGLQESTMSASRSVTDMHSNYISSGRARHTRTTSNNSQFSTASRPSAPYNAHHPLRATPRPYTPPITRSFTTTSVMASDEALSDEHSADATPIAEEEIRFRQRIFDTTKKRADSGASLPPAPAPHQQLRHQASGSLTRLTGNNPSQSSFSAHSVHRSRSRGDTLRSIDSAAAINPPSSRTSLDKAIAGLLRSNKSEEQLDPALARAMEIRAARQAYAEREELKDKKAHAEEARRQRKQSVKEERARRKSDAATERESRRLVLVHEKQHFTRARAGTASSSGKSSTHTRLDGDEKRPRPSCDRDEKGLLSKAYADTLPTHAESLPTYVPTPPVPGAATRTGAPRGSTGQEPKNLSGKSRWLSFVAWFRTRVLRVSRGMRTSR